MIITQTPFRMSFFGGGTDMESFFRENGGSVLSTTFDKYCYVNVRHLPRFFDYSTELSYSKTERVTSIDDIQHPAIRNAMKMLDMHEIRLTYEADLPARSGLGTSSSFAVGMLNAFYALKGKYADKKKLADEAIYLERNLCQEAGGWQDQIAASFGGFNRINFNADGYEVLPVIISPERKKQLNQNLMMFFTGFTRFSSEVQKANAADKVDKTAQLREMLSLVDDAEKVLTDKEKNLDDFGRLLDHTWKLKRQTGSAVSTNSIDELVKGISVGRTTVTCTLNNGKKAICDVYVVPKAKKISNVPLIGQSKLPTGCETCSATMLLKHYGYNISETTFADKYLVKKPFGYSNGSYTGPDPNCAFVGTPYSSNSYGAYAPIMVKCMNKYLSDKSYKAVEISGKSLEYLSGKYVAQGQPIMIWATINMLPSFKTTSWRVNYTDENAKYKLGSYYTWIAREHCLVMTGYDNYYYYFNDPWTNARTRYSKSVVNSRYAELGKQAVVMVKK